MPLPLAPSDPARLGMSFVHQDLGLIESADGVRERAGRELPHALGWRVSWRAERRLVAASLERFGVAVRADALVSALTPVDQALVAIVRAIEPAFGASSTACSSSTSRRRTCRATASSACSSSMRSVAAGGTRVLFVTHRLDEVLEVATA